MADIWIGRGGDDVTVGLHVTSDRDEVARLAGSLVERDPVAYTVFGTIAAAVLRDGSTPWAAQPEDSPVLLAARSEHTTAVGFSAGWTDVREVTDAIAALDPPAVGLGGPPDTVLAVAEALGRAITKRMDERLFRLDELVPPRATDGTPRLAGDDDAAWLAAWYTDFAIEAFGGLPPGFDAARMIDRGARSSRCWIWSGADGSPRSIAVAHPPVAGVSRIGPVYTPPEFRGHGYGSAATAAASRDILEAGDIACLYTDLANPTSNKIYQQLGYRRVLDRSSLRFD
jgi:GNAT superfamily N-acetyltransferase